MACCCCYCETDHYLSCSHVMCKKCAILYISTKWKSGSSNVNCPMCREGLKLTCRMNNDKPIFKYDKEIYFTISALGVLVGLPCHPTGQASWAREAGGRLGRCPPVEVLPILTLHSCRAKSEVSIYQQ
jgi:hypothetical protein